jgi:hypothetical protein
VGKATVRVGPVGIGRDNQPRIDHVKETRRFDVRDCNANGTTLSPPNVPWRWRSWSRPPSSRRTSTPRRAKAAGWEP